MAGSSRSTFGARSRGTAHRALRAIRQPDASCSAESDYTPTWNVDHCQIPSIAVTMFGPVQLDGVHFLSLYMSMWKTARITMLQERKGLPQIQMPFAPSIHSFNLLNHVQKFIYYSRPLWNNKGLSDVTAERAGNGNGFEFSSTGGHRQPLQAWLQMQLIMLHSCVLMFVHDPQHTTINRMLSIIE